MSANAAALHPTHAAAQQAEDAQYYRHVLHELIDMGASLARGIHQQAAADPHPDPSNGALSAEDPALAFDRIARCVRRTILLARSLAEPVPQPKPAPPGRTAARKRIIREVEDAIHREAKGPRAEALGAEFAERLDAPDLDDDIAARPIAEIINDICRDLGLAAQPFSHSGKRRTPGDVANLNARAAQPSGTAPRRAPRRRQATPNQPPSRTTPPKPSPRFSATRTASRTSNAASPPGSRTASLPSDSSQTDTGLDAASQP